MAVRQAKNPGAAGSTPASIPRRPTPRWKGSAVGTGLSDSDAYIKAYVEADPDVQRETSPARNIEARMTALACGVLSDMARTGELEKSLADG